MCDETLLVVRTDVVRASVINDTIMTIKDVGGNFSGCILNDVFNEFNIAGQFGFDEGGYYSSHHYGRYGKYGKYGRYGKYDKYGNYGKYGSYGRYGNYGNYGKYGGYGRYGYYSDHALVDDIVDDELKGRSAENIDDGELL